MDNPRIHQPQGGGTIFEEIRRQMEDMLGGGRPMGPTVIPGAPIAGQRRPTAPNDHLGLALTSVASYWLLPIMAAKRKQRRARAAQDSPPADDV